ncbi:class F sortase [Paractinoplanes hotanensis]|uniref:Class F sortase n=1 Tax=Paractinoplanes hotanensis TaxID=2906497 RepID=A0ABT0YDP6_9ACTN|nr:class F sortase [Actinoplanes hotanensis]MCM4083628.1 class F sortase [Actinoplanes hotanensis]
MAAEDADTPLIVRVPASPEARAATTVRNVPRAAEEHEAEGLGWVARGVAKIVKPGTVQARATVPGALSIPRPKPSRLLRLGQAAMPFPRRVFPRRADPGVEPEAIRPPTLRAAIPAADRSEQLAIMDAPLTDGTSVPAAQAEHQLPKDGPHPVRKKGLVRRAALPAVAATVAAFVAGAAYLTVTYRPVEDLGRWGAQAESAAPRATTVGERPAGDPFGSVAVAPTGAPTRLRIGAVKIDTPLETLRIGGDGALQPPKAFAKAGWYADGTAPGDTGPAVIAGHVDSKTGPAVFYRLRELTTGDRIEVVRGGESMRFTVTAIRWYPKTEFPTEEVYGPTPDRQLRLITCGGVFDRSLRSYRDNLVVYAVAG